MAETTQTSRLRTTLRALRHRNFRLFFAGQLISLIGTWMQNVAQSWLVYRLTGSSALLGMVGFAGQIPVFLIAPVGGLIADRYSRQRIVIATQTSAMLLAFVFSALTLTGSIHVWHIFVLAALLGIVNAFDMPARQAFLVEMVGRDDLINAIALNSSMFNGARIIGPAVAGILVAAIGEGWCFFANGVSYIAVIIGLLLMTVAPTATRVEGSAISHIIEGFRFVAHTGPIRALLLLLGLVSITGMPYAVLMPIFADKIFHSGARGLGILMGFAGLGALMGALTLATRRGVKGLGRWVPIACGVFGASLILFAFSRSFWLAAAGLVPVGFAMMTQMGASNTLIQTMAPDRLRGRVMSVYSMMFMGMAPVGALLAGVVAERFGAPFTVAAGGVIAIAGSILFGLRWPELRPEARQLVLAQQMVAGNPAEEVTAQGEEASESTPRAH
jgi:MFS family permease